MALLCGSLAARLLQVAAAQVRGLLFSAAPKQGLQQPFRLSPRCVCAQREASATFYGPGTGETKTKNLPSNEPCGRGRSLFVLCESNHCSEGNVRCRARSWAATWFEKSWRATAPHAQMPTSPSGVEKTWRKASPHGILQRGAKFRGKKMARGRERRKWGISTCRAWSLGGVLSSGALFRGWRAIVQAKVDQGKQAARHLEAGSGQPLVELMDRL